MEKNSFRDAVNNRDYKTLEGFFYWTIKQNYWRGFRACVILVIVPMLVAFVVFCNALINL